MAGSKNPRVRLGHIRDEIADLATALDQVEFQTFAETYVLRRTTDHAILIISEAVKALSPAFTDHHEGVDWRAVRDVGNVLRHNYFAVDSKVLWRIAKERLPGLRAVLERMIVEESGP